jgi:hypothetical protein
VISASLYLVLALTLDGLGVHCKGTTFFERERGRRMATAFLLEIPNFTPEQGSAVVQALGLDTNPAAGQLFHLEGPMDGGMRIVDVWESPEAFQTFVHDRLVPAFQKVGVALPANMQPTAVWPVTGMFP